MSYPQPADVFPPEAPSFQERTLRLRQQILQQQQYRRKLDDRTRPLEGNAFHAPDGDRSSGSYWEVERHITDLRIWEMEGKLTALLDILSD